MLTESIPNEVWEKGVIVPGYDKNIVRKDCCGAWILRSEYSNRNSKFGWEVDHVYPKSKGGGDDIENRRPMQWENNLSKGDDFPSYTAAVQSKENDNVYIETQYEVNENLRKQLVEKYNKVNK